jgi:two-component system OmpR family response regulator
VLLDLGLPGKDGLEVLASIRAKDNPIPCSSSRRAMAWMIACAAWMAGPTTTCPSPFRWRNCWPGCAPFCGAKVARHPVLSNGVVSLDPATKEASVNGGPVQLSNREFSLLQALLVRPGAILSRSELEDRIYGWGKRSKAMPSNI